MFTDQTEQALLLIESYIWDLREPQLNWTRGRFEQASYSIWAANEIHEFVRQHEGTSPVEAVMIFADKMCKYSTNPRNGRRFGIAYDTAQDILDMMLAVL